MTNKDTAVIEYLSQKEHLNTSLIIANTMDQVKAKLHKDLWETVERRLTEELHGHAKKDEWKVCKEDGLLATTTRIQVGVSFRPTSVDQSFYIYPWVGISKERNVFCRIAYSEDEGARWDEPRLEAVRALREELRTKWAFEGCNKYDCWKNAGHRAACDEYFLKIAENRDSLVAEIVSLVWDPFVNLLPQIERANAAIAAAMKNEVDYP